MSTFNSLTVYLIFVHQEDHQFVIVLVLTGDLAQISVMDRGGVVHTDPINIIEEPRLFLHAILGLTFADDIYLGYDPTIVKHPDGPSTITVGLYDTCKSLEAVNDTWKGHNLLARNAPGLQILDKGIVGAQSPDSQQNLLLA